MLAPPKKLHFFVHFILFFVSIYLTIVQFIIPFRLTQVKSFNRDFFHYPFSKFKRLFILSRSLHCSRSASISSSISCSRSNVLRINGIIVAALCRFAKVVYLTIQTLKPLIKHIVRFFGSPAIQQLSGYKSKRVSRFFLNPKMRFVAFSLSCYRLSFKSSRFATRFA